MSSYKTAGVIHVGVTRGEVPRVLRMLQGIAAECQRRGHEIRPSKVRGNGACIAVHGHEYELLVRELLDKHPHEPTAAELKQMERSSWHRVPEWDYVPSGRLQLELPHHRTRSRRRWSGGVRAPLEAKLGHVLQEIELRAIAGEERRIERERVELEKRREHEALLERVRGELQDEHRANELKRQVADWRTAEDIRAYCDAVERQESRGVELGSWIDWSRRYADRIDPLVGLDGTLGPGLKQLSDEQVKAVLRERRARQRELRWR